MYIFWIFPLRFLLNFLIRIVDKRAGISKNNSVVIYPIFIRTYYVHILAKINVFENKKFQRLFFKKHWFYNFRALCELLLLFYHMSLEKCCKIFFFEFWPQKTCRHFIAAVVTRHDLCSSKKKTCFISLFIVTKVLPLKSTGRAVEFWKCGIPVYWYFVKQKGLVYLVSSKILWVSSSAAPSLKKLYDIIVMCQFLYFTTFSKENEQDIIYLLWEKL